jgi:hypothetical protein
VKFAAKKREVTKASTTLGDWALFENFPQPMFFYLTFLVLMTKSLAKMQLFCRQCKYLYIDSTIAHFSNNAIKQT